MDIQIIDETETETVNHLKLVHDILNFAGTYLKLPSNTEISVTLMGNDAIQKINKKYRSNDKPTDVISFAINDYIDPIIKDDEFDEIPINLGDLMISLDKVNEQSQKLGHSYERELGFLCVHGLLHLKGYDHMEPDDEQQMIQIQKNIMREYGLER